MAAGADEKAAEQEAGSTLLTQGDEDRFDDIIEAIGNDGPFQKRFNLIFNLALVCLMTMPYLNLVLAMSVPTHHCHIPGLDASNTSMEEWWKHIPKVTDPKTTEEGLNSCQMYVNGTEVVGCQNGWDYDRQWYQLTAPSMQNWVCDHELYVTNTFVASRIGELIGIFIFGQLGDRIGRKPVYYISLTLLLFGRIMTVFTSHIYELFLAVVVIGSTSTVSVFQTPIVIGMEVSAENKRAHIAFMQCVAWVAGNCALPLLTWVLGDWRWMIVITTAPTASAYLLYRLIPESPRWLASQGRVEDATKVLQYIADINGTKLPKNTNTILENIAGKKEKTYGIPSLFFHRRLAKNTIMIITSWVVCGLSYYSLVLNISNMAGNPFMNYFWQSLVELPGYVIGRYLGNKIGRRWTQTGSQFLAVCLCGCVILSHGMAPWVTTMFVTCVKFCFTVSFYMVWLQAMEIYPTCLRQTGTSIGGLAANIFGILGPYVVYLGTTIDPRLPFVVLLCLAALGSICSSMLPETLNIKLPETMEDATNFGKSQKFWSLNKAPRKAPWITTMFVFFVRFCVTVAFYALSMQAMEIFPTCLRQTGNSLGGVTANLFGILGPYIVYLGTSRDPRLPFVVLQGLLALGSISSSMLPETLNIKLPETIKDATDLGKNQKFWSLNKA